MIKYEKGDACITVLEATKVEDLNEWFNRISDDSVLILDWETTGLDYDTLPLLLGLYSPEAEYPLLVPIDYFFEDGLPMEDVAECCNKQLGRFRLCAHNAKFDSMVSLMNGISDDVLQFRYDSLVMIHLVNPDLEKNLERRVKIDFKYSKKEFKEWAGKAWNKINWSVQAETLKPLLIKYCGEDVFWEYKIFEKYSQKMDADAWKLHDKIEIPLVNILRDAKIRGVKINRKLLEKFEGIVEESLKVTQQKIYDKCGCVFNLNSPKQKQEVFFDKMGLPIISYTKTGGRSTDTDTYSEWESMGFEIGKLLCEYSELDKLRKGYLLPIPQMLDDQNVLRGDLNSCGTRTGRFSSSNPNLQNMPNNHRFPVREAFIPREGYVFINYDYSQLELRVMAHMSKDEKFIQIFKEGRDPHGEVAKDVGITRKQAKVLNFGVLYGMGPDKYMHEFSVAKADALAMIDGYHKAYKGFARWKTATENFAKRNGYVKNLFGRKRVLTECTKMEHLANKSRYYEDLRKSVNTRIQGTGADLIKLATIETVRQLKERKIDCHFLLQVHDENLWEVKREQMLEAERIIIDCMEHTTELIVPLIADGKIIENWGEMKDDEILSVPFRDSGLTSLSLLGVI